MTLREEIEARIQAIQDKRDADILVITNKANEAIAELKMVYLSAEEWIDKDTDQFQALVNKMVSIVRQTG
jgi:hypothetical protein